MGRTPGVSGDIMKEFRKVSFFQIDQQPMSKQMETDKKLFETVGRTREEYWENEKKNIQFRLDNELEFKRISDENYKKQLRNELEGVRIRREAPRVAVHESIFQSTGIMTKFLEDQKMAAIRHSLSKATDNRKKDLIRNKKMAQAEERAQIDIIKLFREKNSIKLAEEKTFFTEAGVMGEQYRTRQIQDINAEIDLNKIKYKDQIAAVLEWGAEMRRNFEDTFAAPMLAKWEKYYSSIGVMSDEHYQIPDRPDRTRSRTTQENHRQTKSR